MSNVFCAGGGGYVGTLLVSKLLAKGHKVTVYDIFYFGNYLPIHDNLTVIYGDIRDAENIERQCSGHEIFVNLACISNDSSFALDERLSTSINLDAFEPMVVSAKRAGISRFIFASSSSVYGVSEKENVVETDPLVPLTLYNKYKGMCEPLLFKHTDENFTGVVFRPATVCGYSPRMRLDLSVNILTHHAITKNHITVFGGTQERPNLHIADYCDVVELLMEAPKEKIANEIFNVGCMNASLLDLARIVKISVMEDFPEIENIEITTELSEDLRSYRINSDKIKKILGFVPKHSVTEAVEDICRAYADGLIRDDGDDHYYNVRQLKKLNVA